MNAPDPVAALREEVAGVRAQAAFAMAHAKKAGDRNGTILSACLADEVGREPLDRAKVAKAAHDVAEEASRAYLNARETIRRADALLAHLVPLVEARERVEALAEMLAHYDGAVLNHQRFGEGFHAGLAFAADHLRAANALTPTEERP